MGNIQSKFSQETPKSGFELKDFAKSLKTTKPTTIRKWDGQQHM